jgi:diguanylate cyclase (GGDEF)-like protein
MDYSFFTLAFDADLLTGVLGTVIAVALSFVSITLISSYYRFHNIINLAENTQPEEMGSTPEGILRVQLARYLAGCARRNTAFCLSLIRCDDERFSSRIDGPLMQALRLSVRASDISCVFDEQTIALLTELDPGDSEATLHRVFNEVGTSLSIPSSLTAGLACYPGHGLSGKELQAVAGEALLECSTERPVYLPEQENPDEEEVLEEEGVEPLEPLLEETEAVRRRRERKLSMIDELTGVLKPSVISSYMQRLLSDLRRKKLPVALFTIGVNNMATVNKFHGEAAADDVLAGVSEVLREHTRADDLIGRHEKYAFLMLMQVTPEQAEVIGKRLSTLVQAKSITSGSKKLKTTITLGVATYPDHGRNLHHLYTAAQKVLDYNRENDIRAYAVYNPEIHGRMVPKPMKSIKSVQA